MKKLGEYRREIRDIRRLIWNHKQCCSICLSNIYDNIFYFPNDWDEYKDCDKLIELEGEIKAINEELQPLYALQRI